MGQIKKQLESGLLLLMIIFMLPFGCVCSNSEGKAGNAVMTAIQGEVLVKTSGAADWVQGATSMNLKAGDIIKSGSEASGTVTFFDGSTIQLKANTQIEISELIEKKDKVILLKQEAGETFSKVEKMADTASRYEIETPVAVAAVRGSQMKVAVASNGTTEVQNVEGKISVTAQGQELQIPEGGTGIVNPGESPMLDTVYSALDDYSMDNNPNGTWSYGWMPTDFSVFNLYTAIKPGSFQWHGAIGGDFTPGIWLNKEGERFGVPTGWLSIHPGPGKEPCILRWTVPIKGSVHVTGQFLAGDRGMMSIAIRKNGEEVWTGSDAGDFDLTENVSAGDTLDFAVFGGYGYGNTPISVTISYN